MNRIAGSLLVVLLLTGLGAFGYQTVKAREVAEFQFEWRVGSPHVDFYFHTERVGRFTYGTDGIRFEGDAARTIMLLEGIVTWLNYVTDTALQERRMKRRRQRGKHVPPE